MQRVSQHGNGSSDGCTDNTGSTGRLGNTGSTSTADTSGADDTGNTGARRRQPKASGFPEKFHGYILREGTLLSIEDVDQLARWIIDRAADRNLAMKSLSALAGECHEKGRHHTACAYLERTALRQVNAKGRQGASPSALVQRR